MPHIELCRYHVLAFIDGNTIALEVQQVVADVKCYMGQVTELRLSCYLVLLSVDSKTR